MKHREIDQVTRWYPTQFGIISGDDIFNHNYIDMYIHIPFCLGKCAFCPFNSKPINKENLDLYFQNLKTEITMYANEPYFKYKTVRSLWIGGGTPSAVPFNHIKEILDLVTNSFDFSSDAEITLETNLHDLSEDYIKLVSASRINRLSIGVQSFTEKFLKMMGRTYTPKWIDSFFAFIGKYDLTISIDMMFRYPGQTLDDVQKEIDLIGKYSNKIDHITLYGLILFPKLGIFKRVASGQLPKQAKLSVYEKMCEMFNKQLSKYGYHQYTSHHFAKKGKENVYNNDRWGFPQIECVSFGPGSFGQLNGFVYCNEHNTTDYYNKISQGQKPIQMGKKINLLEQASRFLVLGTKCRRVDLKLFRELTGIDPLVYYATEISELLEDGLIEIDNDVLYVTERGCTYIVDIGYRFQTDNNRPFPQPQYTILDMFEGQKDTFGSVVIEADIDEE